MGRWIGLLGLVTLLGIPILLSSNRRAIRWRTVGWGLGLQLMLALFILRTTVGGLLFEALGSGITSLLDYSKQGSAFIFGGLASDPKSYGFLFAFQILPTIVFVASLISVLYHLGLVQRLVNFLAWLMVRTMGVSGAEALSGAACVFVGQVEGPLLVMPYISTMTRSELMALMTGGMATIAGGVLAAYIGMLGPQWAPHLLAASIMGAPAGLVMAKLLVPETEQSVSLGTVKMEVKRSSSSIIEAAARGASDGMHLAFTVGAMLLSFIALVALADGGLHLVGGLVNQAMAAIGHPTHLVLSMEGLLGAIFAPLAYLMGVPAQDMFQIGSLLGQKIVLNEFVSYSQLAAIIAGHSAVHLTPKAITIATYALCGFANFSSVAQNVGGIGEMAPDRRSDLARLGLRAMLGGFLASCLTATIAGLLT